MCIKTKLLKMIRKIRITWQVSLKGSPINPGGIGAEVTLFYSDTLQTIQQYPVRGYISSVDYTLHFGLGKKEYIDSLRVLWPDEKIQILRNIAANQRITFSYIDAENRNIKNNEIKNPLLKEADEMVAPNRT